MNFQSRSPEEISGAADYAVNSGEITASILSSNGLPLSGTVLELGPGIDFGVAFLVGENSSRLMVADRFLASWQDAFHMPLYREMQRRLRRPSPRLDAVVAQAGYEGVLESFEEPAYDMKSIADNSVDLVYSNAVLEHVYPLDVAVREMYRITKPGGYGAHQVDFRYHRNFDFPLEHLLFTRDEYAHLLELTHCETGCQIRVKEAVEIFEAAGFEVVKVDVNQRAPDDYMEDFMQRLQRSPLSPYYGWEAEELGKISARLIVRKR